MDARNGATPIDLRPIIARLRDIERKCTSMGSRNEEFPLMRARVAALIVRLEAADSGADDALGFSALARELFPVAHLFESVGMMSVGREIAHVERSLRELDPVPTPPPAGALRQVATGPAVAAAHAAPPADAEPPQLPSRRERPGAPAVVAMLLLLVAVAVAATIVLRVGPAARLLGRERRPPAPAPGAQPTAPPAADPTPLPTPAPLRMPTAAAASGRLNDDISQARLALARGDLETAAERLAAAALIDRRHPDLAEIGDRLVDLFLAEAELAAAGGRWERAAGLVERARRMAMRFGLDEARVRASERRIGAMERFELLSPQDLRALDAAAGRRAEVRMRDGSVRGGRVEGVAGVTLLLAVEREVGGGGLRYTDELPLAEIAEIKIFDD